MFCLIYGMYFDLESGYNHSCKEVTACQADGLDKKATYIQGGNYYEVSTSFY